MRKFGVIFSLIALVIATSLGITFWSALNNDTTVKLGNMEKEASDLHKAELLIAADKADEALPIIQQYRGQMESFSPGGAKWLDLYVKAQEKEKNVGELIILFDFYPETFKNNEDASLLLANEFILQNKQKEYASLRSLVNGNETKNSAWFVLDADYMLLQGRREEAVDFLKSKSFQGKNDVNRLIRLALLKSNEKPKESWGYLTEAFNKDPYNVDIRTFRARLLENGGKPDQARSEYSAAVNLLPSNLYLKDQLAEFYVRQKEYPLALEVWKSNLYAPTLDIIWVKSYFWNRVIRPINFNWKNNKIPPGQLEPLISYYVQLNQDQFWDKAAYSQIADGIEFLKTQQSTFWLRLLQNLKENDEKEANNLLTYNPFATNSWNQDLETTLKYTLNYRINRVFIQDSAQHVIVGQIANDPLLQNEGPDFIKQFIAQVEESNEKKSDLIISKRFHDLLMSNEIYTVLFLSADWSEAALQLNDLGIVSDEYPQWITFGLVKALSQNRGKQQALDFAIKQTATPELQLYIAELYMALNNPAEATEVLQQITHIEGDIGNRATLLLSDLYIKNKDYQKAKDIISKNKTFSQSILGKETLAHIAIFENDPATAEQIYSSIEKNSAEARSYLAKRAYAEKNWQRARELTEQLIKEFPDNDLLKENLKRIVNEESKKAKTQ